MARIASSSSHSFIKSCHMQLNSRFQLKKVNKIKQAVLNNIARQSSSSHMREWISASDSMMWRFAADNPSTFSCIMRRPTAWKPKSALSEGFFLALWPGSIKIRSAGGIFGFPQLVYSPRYSRGGRRGRRLPSFCQCKTGTISVPDGTPAAITTNVWDTVSPQNFSQICLAVHNHNESAYTKSWPAVNNEIKKQLKVMK